MSDWPRPLHGWDHRHWSSAERTDYERELLRLLNEYFDFRPREDRPYVLSIESHGTYAETVLTVRHYDPERQQTCCSDSDVWPWREDPKEVGVHDMNTPESDASLITLAWDEGLFFRKSRHCE